MRRIIRALPVFSLSLLFALAGRAQSGKVKGSVKDAEGNALPGASVTVAHSKIGTVTDEKGYYTLNIPAGSKTITVSFIGQATQQAAVMITDGITLVRDFSMSNLYGQAASVVVGTRLKKGRSKLTTTVPVDVINTKDIKPFAQTDISQMLTYTVPSFQSARQTISDGTDHVDPAQLRGLGSDQLLVLINGKRRHQSALVNVNGTVNRGQTSTDFSTIPASAIERFEILRDGASAQYGSDAIAGVVNIILKKNTNGLSGTLSYGENITAYPKNYDLGGKKASDKTSVTDGGNFLASLNYGAALKHDGYINLNAELLVRDKTNRTGTYTGQIYPSVGGVVKDDSIMAARGTNRNMYDMRIGNSKMNSGSLLMNSQFALSEKWNLQVVAEYSKKMGEAAGFFRYPSSIASGAGSFRNVTLAKYPEGFLPLIQTDISDLYLSTGVSGKLGMWDASLSNTFGSDFINYTVDHSINYTQFAFTTQVQSKFDAGAIGFLQNTINADLSRRFNVLQGLNLACGAEFRVEQYRQKEGEAASYLNYSVASGATPGAQVFAGFTPQYAGRFRRNVTALYADAEQDFTKNLLVSGALRFEHYNDFGNTINYKLAARYKFGNILSIRGSASTGFRAPGMQQRFYAKTNTLFVSVNGTLQPTETGTFPNKSKPAEILGIPELKNETSANFGAGITARPFRNFEISLDGYWIDIKNRIVLTNNFTGGNNAVLDSLLKANGASQANFFANAITTQSKGLEAVANYHFVVARRHHFNLTAAATLMKNEVDKDLTGKPIINASTVLVNSGQIDKYFNREDQSRIEVAIPSSKEMLSIAYSFSKLSVQLRFTNFGKVTYLDPSINPNNPASWPVNAYTGKKETLDQVFSPKTVTDVSVSYRLVKTLSLTVGSNNLFDVYQDKNAHSGNVSLGRFVYSRRVEQMGFNGRFVFARLSFEPGNSKNK